MIDLLKIIVIIFFSTVPLLFWGYGTIYLSEHVWNRGRFFAGMIGGFIAVSTILLFENELIQMGYAQIFAVLGVFFLLGVIISRVVLSGSAYIRGFLLRSLVLHIGLFTLLLLIFGVLREMIFIDIRETSLAIILSGLFIGAYLEEGVKHVSSLGLTARDFRFSRRDLLVFTFFVTLGFTMTENLLYFTRSYDESIGNILMTGIYRLCFALPLHIFAASITVMLWWRALSYRIFSLRYILLFSSGFLLATAVHTLYNSLIELHVFAPLIALSGIGYIATTQWMLSDESKNIP